MGTFSLAGEYQKCFHEIFYVMQLRIKNIYSEA